MHPKPSLPLLLPGLAALLLPVIALDSAQTPFSQGFVKTPNCAWARLNATLDGRLQSAAPYAHQCFEDSEGYDVAACAQTRAEYLNPARRSDQFGAYVNVEWEACQASSEQCALNWMDPSVNPPRTCQQGAVPNYYIDVQGHEDVAIAFEFSKVEGVPVTVKNTGHDYMGRSSGPNTLGLWTHNLKSVELIPDFVPEGCTDKEAIAAVTFGSGNQFSDLLEFANANDLTIPGGSDATVGVGGGYLQGGGHSPLSNIFGLAVDRVLQFEVVVPTGDLLIANECQNSDLFFALRGGGGGTFGVVLSATTRALPKANLVTVSATFNPETPIDKFLEFVIPHSVGWSEDGWSGYIYTLGIFHMSKLDVSPEDALTYFAPLKTFLADSLNITLTATISSSYGEFHEKFLHKSSEGLPKCIPVFAASRLIPASTFEDSPEDLLNTMTSLMKQYPIAFIFANTPYGYEQFDGVSPSSVTPAWRTSIWDVTFGQVWDHTNSVEEHRSSYHGLSNSMNALRAITPGGGAYFNEADVYEPEWQDAFWGENYEKLLAIKQKYDPGHLLDCWRCVGWKGKDDSRYSCYL
ncbi:FAD-binding domain-containing protein [Cylindrobasidium torrendii FP15055 ss-10]|uniref:FAD-binding domain-containing protein n=1 Tax=Cylindrobasidium torrendii FP15055 ss-10 TaxID=1314674 RepID=A0A0D7BJM3_9AGAR|nr:FAD-binding domain-containing protein [Cylindrobasidium torrendii FP15055 ss-10]